MLAPLVLLAVAASLWFFVAPGERFLQGLAGLLSTPVVHRGPLGFLAGRADIQGTFGSRDMQLMLQLKRGRHGLGFLELAMSTARPHLGSGDLDARALDDAGRAARAALVQRGLAVSAEDGWLKTRWAPTGLGMFPGRFEEAHWRRVLVEMDALATSIER